MKILVTGSSGFVGKALVAALQERGHDVRGLSRAVRAGSLQGDLLDPSSLSTALQSLEPEIVYNLAGQTDLKGPASSYAANVEGVANLLDAVAAAPSVRRVVWASSQLVNRPGPKPTSFTHCDPGCAYGASKAEGERLVRERDGGGKEWVIFRSTTIWGPGMSHHYANILRMIRRGRYFHIGRRPLRKSYSYIENLAAQLTTLGEAPAARVHGRTFYLADSEPVELRHWHDRFAAAFGRCIPTVPLPLARLAALAGDAAGFIGIRSPITSHRLSNMLTEYLHDVRDIEAVHGPTAISNEEGVRRTAEWLKSLDAAGPLSQKAGA
ncbi:MAG TPA: NAD(P)-dependent oxidoreductase [Allosphingosinicella sp.]|uniref:NAD-dependent epimerase/dehydratase family protein n=1 Tax=Allosphingosinicella sp. TaxID=2823234 RepID=UPI002EDA0AFD